MILSGNTHKAIVSWLREGDISIRYQTERDLFGDDRARMRARIAREGWGARLLDCRRSDGHWGRGFYQPKWTSTHYTLLDLRHLCIDPGCTPVCDSVAIVLRDHKGADGGLNSSTIERASDVCVNGMALQYCAYFGAKATDLTSIVDFLLSEHLVDGGFNCDTRVRTVHHSSMHTTLSVLEGIAEYARSGYTYRLGELQSAAAAGREFLLQHRLYRSDRSDAIIKPSFLMLSWPSRWFYDILRALDYFRSIGTARDARMDDALAVLRKKRRVEGRWPLQARHPGKVHFEMETTGQPSRWNTLRAMRVLEYFDAL
jgi:hypothetical protein